MLLELRIFTFFILIISKTWSKSVNTWDIEFDYLWIFYLQDFKGATLIFLIFYLPTTNFLNILCASQLLYSIWEPSRSSEHFEGTGIETLAISIYSALFYRRRSFGNSQGQQTMHFLHWASLGNGNKYLYNLWKVTLEMAVSTVFF